MWLPSLFALVDPLPNLGGHTGPPLLLIILQKPRTRYHILIDGNNIKNELINGGWRDVV
jgi:hypothetical protein